ncbi:MAG TPA: hypothetical protein VGM51_12060 [Armatimonadota bacterium]|jgi:hypothetical protein
MRALKLLFAVTFIVAMTVSASAQTIIAEYWPGYSGVMSPFYEN